MEPVSNRPHSSLEMVKRKLSKRPQNEVLYQIYKGSILGAFTTMLLTPGLYAANMVMLLRKPVLRHSCRGMLLKGANVVPATTIQVTGNAIMQRILFPNKKPGELSFLDKLCCSTCAGIVSGIATAPGEMAVINYQAQEDKAEHMIRHILVRVYQAGGIPRLFAGGLAQGAREGFWTLAYQTLSPALGSLLRSNFLGGVLSGVLVGFMTNPIHYLKTQKQSEAMHEKPSRSYVQIMKANGLGALLRGSSIRAPLVGIGCVVFSGGNQFLGKWFRQE